MFGFATRQVINWEAPLGITIVLKVYFLIPWYLFHWGGRVRNVAKPNKKTFYTMAMEAIMVGILSHIPNWLEDLFAFDMPDLFFEPYLTY